MACDTDDREGESPSLMEPRLGQTFHSSATGRRREQTLPEALGLRQARHSRDDTAESAGSETGRPGAMRPTELRSRAEPGRATRIRELTAYAVTGDRPRTPSGSRSSGAANRLGGGAVSLTQAELARVRVCAVGAAYGVGRGRAGGSQACKSSAVRVHLSPLVRCEIRTNRTASTAVKYSHGGRLGRRTCVRNRISSPAGAAGPTSASRC